MAFQIAPFLMILSDLQDYSPIASLFQMRYFRTVLLQLTRFQVTWRVVRSCTTADVFALLSKCHALCRDRHCIASRQSAVSPGSLVYTCVLTRLM